METFSALLAIFAGNSPVISEFPAQRPVTRALMFSLICARINGWANNRDAGDLRRHHAHYDVIIMIDNNFILHISSANMADDITRNFLTLSFGQQYLFTNYADLYNYKMKGMFQIPYVLFVRLQVGVYHQWLQYVIKKRFYSGTTRNRTTGLQECPVNMP